MNSQDYTAVNESLCHNILSLNEAENKMNCFQLTHTLDYLIVSNRKIDDYICIKVNCVKSNVIRNTVGNLFNNKI